MSTLFENKSEYARNCEVSARPSGRLRTRLTTVVRVLTFFLRRTLAAGETHMVRSDLECTLHRLANHVECQLGDIIRELLAESRINAVHDIAWASCRFIESCRNVRDGKEGGDA